jgi:hypothetical protein
MHGIRGMMQCLVTSVCMCRNFPLGCGKPIGGDDMTFMIEIFAKLSTSGTWDGHNCFNYRALVSVCIRLPL